jgi:3-hydroxyacyl-CoA dehydrogenase
MVYLTGYGFPLHRGGPMCYADTVGLYNVAASMRTSRGQPAGRCITFWMPAPLLTKLASERQSRSADICSS